MSDHGPPDLIADPVVADGVPAVAPPALHAPATPPALAQATAPGLRPGRGFVIAACLHLLLFGVLFVIYRAHLAAPAADQQVVALVMPSQSAAAASQPVSRVAAPPSPATPALRQAVALPLPLAARGVLPLPPPPAPSAAKPQPKPMLVARPAQAMQHLAGPRPAAANLAAIPAHPDPSSNNQPPVYPPIARQLGEQGPVLLSILILKNGMVGRVNVSVSSGYARLDHAALDAVSNWHFQPAIEDGAAVDSTVTYWINFQLD